MGRGPRLRWRGAGLQGHLHRSGVGATSAQVVVVTSIGGVAVATIVIMVTGVVPLGLLVGGAAVSLPLSMVGQRCRAVQAERLAAWPDALRDLVVHLRAGSSVHAGIGLLATTGPVPLRESFARYRALAGVIEQKLALEIVRAELADPASDRIIEVMLIAHDQGPSVIIDLLEDLARAVTADLRLAEDIRTAQLETRLEAWGSAALPFVVLALLCATSDDYRAFYRTGLGWLVILVGSGLVAVGLLAIRMLGRIPAERRVLAGARP
jgi:tight adherence protein B